MFEMHLISGITKGWQGCEPPPLPIKMQKPDPYLGCILAFAILLVSLANQMQKPDPT